MSQRTSPSTILWFRRDLRLQDNLALQAALEKGDAILSVFIWDPKSEKPWQLGEASQWWLHQSLQSLQVQLQSLGTSLILRKGASLKVLKSLVQETQANSVYWNHCYEPQVFVRDQNIQQQLKKWEVEVKIFAGQLLWEPWDLKTKSGKPYQVFTPFWKAGLELPRPTPQVVSKTTFKAASKFSKQISSLTLEDLELEPKINWAQGMQETWAPGELGAQNTLAEFQQSALTNYSEDRDRPDLIGTSRLSPHLHFGEITPRQVWHSIQKISQKKITDQQLTNNISKSLPYLRQLAWREFAYHLLFHFPHTTEHPLRTQFKKFAWKENSADLKSWQQGKTGYPLVDAGMRELWHTGWVHNRVRMLVASFLVKDLLIPWQQGARWFWDTLVDADLANNTLGWQWVAGCGADAAPYFRIFNPTSQAQKFDPKGDYIRKWIPEIAKLPIPYLYEPWKASEEILKKAEIKMGKTYPLPMVDHAFARQRALDALAKMKT